MKQLLQLLITCISLNFSLWAQEKCVSHVYEQMLREKFPEEYGTKEDFERWIAQKLAERRAGISQRSGPYTVPVIIHVVYDSATWQVQSNTRNIPYAQAESQIRVLNRDFNKTNLDFNTVVRAEFQPKASSLNITFVPATKDPNGNWLTEPGVERINGQARFGITQWSALGGNTDNILKPQTIWDPNKYLNIWVVEFQNPNLFGYAEFPAYSLPGNPGGSTNSTDGVVVTWRAFGSNVDPDTGTPTPYVSASNLLCTDCDRGRTTTHELGHWLGLRHIWGDVSGCGNPNSDDYCNDTPDQNTSTPTTSPCPFPNTCPTLEPAYGNTDVDDQRENFMDYSADACMGMFTQDQVARMEVIMDNAPRRASLTTAANLAAVAPPRPNGLYVDIYSNKTQIIEGETVNFAQINQNQGVAAATNFSWNFDLDNIGGVSPATFSGPNPPAITFNKVGTYKVRLTISNGSNTAQSNIIQIDVGLKGPSNLQFLNAEGSGANAKVIDVAKLKWNDNSNSEDNYIVERKKNTDPISAYAVIATLPPNTTTYDDNFTTNPAIVSGQKYDYRIKAIKGSQQGSVAGSIILERATALYASPLADQAIIYPNPTQETLTVNLEALQVQSGTIEIYNAVGQSIQKKAFQGNKVTFDVGHFSKGIYILKVITDKGSFVKRLSIQ